MAMDSHDDNQCKLLIDTVNNNRKTSFVSDSFSTQIECSSTFPSLAETCSGSSRRKCSSFPKTISYSEFIETAKNITATQLTAVDKLILKNRAALDEDQMKRTRVKQKETPPSMTQKKNEKKSKAKVLCSKAAASKHKHQNGPKESADAPRSNVKTNPKSRTPVVKEIQPASKKQKTMPPKVEKRDIRAGQNESKQRSPKPSSSLKLKPVQKNARSHQSILGSRLALKKEPKVNCKSLDTKRLKNKVAYRTRSGNKETLRNGKTRICKDITEALSLQPKKKTRIYKAMTKALIIEPKKKHRHNDLNVSTTPLCLNSRNAIKRPIKQEPLEDDPGLSKKRKLTPTPSAAVEKNNNDEKKTVPLHNEVQLPVELECSVIDNVSINNSNSVKLESLQPVKEEILIKPEMENCSTNEVISVESKTSPNVVEISVNMNIVSHSPVSEEFSLVSDNVRDTPVKTESPANVIEDFPVPNGLVLQDFQSLCDYDTSSVKSHSENEELVLSLSSTEDDTSDSINLQLDSAEDEERSCDSVESITVVERPTVLPTVDSSSEILNEHTDNLAKVDNQVNDDSAKESMFNALGLQSIEKVNQKPKEKDIVTKENVNYTGTLKAVIKTDKGCRRMEMKQDSAFIESTQNESILSFYSKTIQNRNTSDCLDEKTSLHCSSADSSNDSSGMSPLFVEDESEKKEETKNNHSELSYFVNSNNKLTSMIREAFRTEEDYRELAEEAKDKTKAIEPLVVPEKSSSFSIHPNRLCSDVCKYCLAKFGSLDTPCHVGQLKNIERQKKILLCEPHLKLDTCLCDACFRHVDRKARPSINRKTMRTSITQRTVMCAVQNCNQIASRQYTRRKWRSKITRKIANLSFDARRRGPGVTIGLCPQHYCILDMYTLCGICKKRLNRNDMFSIQSELIDLNEALKEDGIPAKLVDNMLLCKYCHHCMSLRLKYGPPRGMTISNRQYYESFKKEVLRCLNVEVSDSEDTNSSEGRKSESCDASSPERLNGKLEELVHSAHEVTDGKHVNVVAASKKNSHNVDIHEIASLLKPLEGEHTNEKNPTRIQLKFGNLNIGKLSNLNIGQNTQPSSDAKHEKSYGDKELPLIADFSFENADSASKNWERCVSTIQFDKGTKKLWQDLQKPYGNQSSFIRHLIMLEKYWRSGALMLSETADPGAVKYINSVKNRVESLETSQTPKLKPATASPPPLTTLPTLSKPSYSPKMSLESAPPPLLPAPKFSNGSAETVGRYPSAPPPLLKLNCLTPFAAPRKTTPVCAVKPSSDISTQVMKPTLPAPPQLEKIPNQNMFTNSKTIPLSPREYKDIIQSHSRPKQITQVQMNALAGQRGVLMQRPPPLTNGDAVMRSVSPSYVIRKSTVAVGTPGMSRVLPINSNSDCSAAVRSVPRNYVMKNSSASVMRRPTVSDSEYNASSLLIAKLPKTLTVTQVESTASERTEVKPPSMAAPFLVGEKPSVSVFREVSK